MNEELETICFELISKVGFARSSYIEAIQCAKEGKTKECQELVDIGNEAFSEGHKVHSKMIQQEASGKSVKVNVILLHAEDLLMSAEAFKILSSEFIDVYHTIRKL